MHLPTSLLKRLDDLSAPATMPHAPPAESNVSTEEPLSSGMEEEPVPPTLEAAESVVGSDATSEPSEPPKSDDVEDSNCSALTAKEMRDILKSKGLSTIGSKTALKERIEASQMSSDSVSLIV